MKNPQPTTASPERASPERPHTQSQRQSETPSTTSPYHALGFFPFARLFGSRTWHQPHSSYRVARLRRSREDAVRLTTPLCLTTPKNCRGQRVGSVVKCSRACIGVSSAPLPLRKFSRRTLLLRRIAPATTLTCSRTPRAAPLRGAHVRARHAATSHMPGAQLPKWRVLMSFIGTAVISHVVGPPPRSAGSLPA
jgi:hypothetical protein